MIDPPQHLKKLFEQDPDVEKSWRLQLADHPNLGCTQWTPKQLRKAWEEHDDHIFKDCETCLKGLNVWPVEYCPVGENLSNTYSDMSQEYSWQKDFDPEQSILSDGDCDPK